MDYHELLDQIADNYSEILGDNLVGIYVHGSIALKCFNWKKSDIDFIVVVNEKLSQDTKRKLMDITMKLNKNAPSKGLEMSIVLKEYCKKFKYPTPFELHFSNMHLEWLRKDAENYCENMHGEDKDLAGHFTIIKEAGIVWRGQSIDEVFGIIPKENYLDSIKEDVKDARNEILENPVYITLNLCRVLAFVRSELILSKEQGGTWGLVNIDQEYHSIINQALHCYRTDETIDIDKKEALRYCDFMFDAIFKY